PRLVRYAQSVGAEAERARNPQELRLACKPAFKRRDGPTLIEVPVGPMPSPWEFIQMPRVRGRRDKHWWGGGTNCPHEWARRPDKTIGLRYQPRMQPITTTGKLADACARMARHPFVTVDTEF